MSWEIREGDALERLREMPDASVHCVVTSPPYWGLRDYGVAGQLGLEGTPEEYTAALVGVFREVRRVMREDATLWLNLGDSYAASTIGAEARTRDGFNARAGRSVGAGKQAESARLHGAIDRTGHGLKPKDLVGIPWRVFFALQADGWWLRSDIIWHKPNPMPESVTDRPTKAHEYVGLFAKSERYFYDADAVAEDSAQPERAGTVERSFSTSDPTSTRRGDVGRSVLRTLTRNRRSVWPIATAPFPEAHFATFPPELPELCIKAGTSEKGCCPECGKPWERVVERGEDPTAMPVIERTGERKVVTSQPGNAPRKDVGSMGSGRPSTVVGWAPTCDHAHEPVPCTVLDPFSGAGTTGLVALRLGRNFIGIELNPKYAAMARNRIDADCPLFNRESA